MTDAEIETIRAELLNEYPGCNVVLSADKCEMVAEISDGLAVAVVERSVPHFHQETKEVYRVLRGILYVACAGRGRVLRQGDSMVIEPGESHFSQCTREPAWIEVQSEPPWSSRDHFILLS